ncbi:MAG TPA: sugar ABC transporter permease [Fimbriimonas sp.]|nr:sugar ABC transporter permease [Fimbriimonas sp.]
MKIKAGYLFAAPWLIGAAIFLVYPLVASFYYSFCDYSIMKPPVWVGLDNYRDLMQDELFWTSVKNTLFYAVFSLPIGMVVALGLAMLLNTGVKGMAIYRAIFFLPSLVPMISMAVLWLWILNGDHGILNTGLKAVGIEGPNWLGNPAWTKISMILMGLWGVGNAVLIYLASLQDVPQSQMEAAQLDGANAWQRTTNITIPMISPVIQFNLIMGIIGTLQVFAVPFVMFPGGAPARSTYFYAMYLYDNAFSYSKMGYASAMGWILFIVIFILTRVAMKMSDRHVYSGGA